MRELPSHRFDLTQGIVSKVEASRLAGRALRSAQNMDGYGTFLGLGKIPGSSAVSPSLSAAIRSLHYHEYTDLQYARQRDILAAANQAIRVFSTTSSWTTPSLPSGHTLADETLYAVSMNDRLFLTSPNQRTWSTGGLKWDGTRLTPWGVLKPGDEKTVHQSFDSSSGLTGSTDVSLSDDSASIDGGGSTQMDKTGTTEAFGYVQDGTALNLDVSSAGQDAGYAYVFLPYGALQKLATSGAAVEIIAGDSTLTNAAHYTFSVGDLIPGWNLLTWLWSDPDSTDGTGATLSDIDTVRFKVNLSGTSTTLSGVLWDYFYTTDEGAPTTAEGSAGNPDGTYTYRVTYLTDSGVESNAGPASASRTVSSKQVSLSAIPTSSDNQVIARRIYRDISGDSVFRFVGQIDDNTTTTFTDNVADASLGSDQPPIVGDSILDNSPPERFSAVIEHENRIVGVLADNPTTLAVSEISSPERFRIIDRLVAPEPIQAMERHGFTTLLYGSDRTFALTGDGITTAMEITEVNAQLGANNARAAERAKALNFALREKELFLVIHPADPWLMNGQILDQFDGLSGLDDAFLIHDRARWRLLVFVGSTIFVWQYGTQLAQKISGEGAGVDPQDLRQGGWYTLSLPAGVTATCAAMVERAADVPELWVGADDGYVYHLQDTDQADWADGAGTEAVNASFETHAVPLGVESAGRGEPRLLRLNYECSAASTWTVTITLLTDPEADSVATVSFDVDLEAASKSEIFPIPMQAAGRAEWARVKLANAISGDDGIFREIEMFYLPRGGMRGPRSS